MESSNVVQFPKSCIPIKRRNRKPISTPHPDEVFLNDLSALLPEDQGLWRSLLHIAAKWAREGVEHQIDIRRIR